MATILVINDNLLENMAVASAARVLGHEAERALNLGEGRDLLAKKGFDAVFLDDVLPDGPGADVLTEIKEKAPDTAIIMMGGDHGAGKTIPRPVDPAEAARVLRGLFPLEELAAEVKDPAPENPRSIPPLKDFREEQERLYLERLLAAVDSEASAAIKVAGVSRAGFYNLLKKHGLSASGK